MNNFIIPATIYQQDEQQSVDSSFLGDNSLNLNFFNGENAIASENFVPAPTEKKKRGRPAGSTNKKKTDEVKTKTTTDGTSIVVVEEEDHISPNLPTVYSNETYMEGFDLGNNVIKQSIAQLDELGYQVMEEFNKVKNSQMKSKYVVLPQLASTLSSIISSKITAGNTINKTVKDAYDLELKRMKETKTSQSDISDEEFIMNAYNAYISAPVGAQPMTLPPTMISMTTTGDQIVRAAIGNVDNEYSMYMSNITPEQNLMNYEHNPNVQTVVIYDAANPAMTHFDVIDITTGQSIPNVPRPDAMFLENLKMDEYNGRAIDTNLDRSYPLIVLNSNNKLTRY